MDLGTSSILVAIVSTPDLDALTAEQLQALYAGLQAAVKLREVRAIDFWSPYAKQYEFFALGAEHDDRGLIAANRVGKSEAGAFETACHLTGHYPPWWPGLRFNRPITAWICGETAESVRDSLQRKLCGEPGVGDGYGTGMLPRDTFSRKPSLARGVTDAFDKLFVKTPFGISTATFKSYKEGRENFQAVGVDWIHLDEEPSPEIRSECKTRLQVSKGSMISTFTPLKGRTDNVKLFDEPALGRAKVAMGIYDACVGHWPEHPDRGHYTREQADRIISQYPTHERDARAFGIPMVGEGRVFLTPEQSIREPRIWTVPLEWPKIWGIDFGINHPFAAVLLAFEADYDVLHVLHCLRVSGQTPLQHVPLLRTIGAAVPVAWPHDGHQRDKGSGEVLINAYRSPLPGMPGLACLSDHATFPDGGMSLEAGISELDQRFATGRLKVAEHLEPFFEEYRQLHREKGLIVRKDDDILSALRYAVMMLRYARAVPLGVSGLTGATTRPITVKPRNPFTGGPM